MKNSFKNLFIKTAFYPFAAALFPVFSLFSTNLGKLSFTDTLLSFDLMLILSGVLYLFFKFIYWNNSKAAFTTLLWIVLISSYGHIQSLFTPQETLNVHSYTYLFIFWIVLMVSVVILVKSAKTNFSNLNYHLNVFSLILLLIPFVNILLVSIPVVDNTKNTGGFENNFTYDEVSTKERPDIYYIIFDRYGSFDTLKDVYGFDNSEFYENLRSKDFYVADKSTANYLKTPHSLASSLNMDLLDNFIESRQVEDKNWVPLYSLLKNYEVWKFLKNIGYKFVHVGSWWEPTSVNIYADKNINTYDAAEFDRVFYKTTIIYHFVELLAKDLTVYDLWQSGNETFQELSLIALDKNPTFTFAHILVPHPPYIYEADGSMVSDPEGSIASAYLKQVEFTNSRILGLVDSIQKISPEAIIVIQSDEGPHPARYAENEPKFDWYSSTDMEINQKMQILNAYYFPDKNYKSLYSSITPVNTFRVVFNNYFNQELDLLNDRNFIYSDHYHPYKIKEITDRLHKN